MPINPDPLLQRRRNGKTAHPGSWQGAATALFAADLFDHIAQLFDIVDHQGAFLRSTMPCRARSLNTRATVSRVVEARLAMSLWVGMGVILAAFLPSI